MFGLLLLLFVTLPVIELAVLIKVGGFLKLGPTLAIVIVTGIVGAALAKRQGLATMAGIRAELEAGRMPTNRLAEGLLILLAGAVLITPGFITDVFGLLLLIPPCRRLFMTLLTRYFESRITVAHFQSGPGSFDDVEPTEDRGPVEVDERLGRPIRHVKNEALNK